MAVMMPSRPKGVLNHGMPAYGYGPNGVSVIIIWRSAADRVIHRLNPWLLELIAQAFERLSAARCADAVSADSWLFRAASRLPAVHVISTSSIAVARGSSGRSNRAMPPLNDAGARSNRIRVRRSTPSSPAASVAPSAR